MTILLIYHDADLVTRQTFAALDKRDGLNVLMAVPRGTDTSDSCGLACVTMAPIRSKFTPAAIRTLRGLIRRHRVDAIFAASTSALSTALFATLGTSTKVVGYRGTQARIRPLDPTYYLALLNPRVSHIVCETPDIEEYLSRYIPSRKLSGMPKPYDRAWVAPAMAKPATDVVAPDGADTPSICYVGITDGRPYKGLNLLIQAVQTLRKRGRRIRLTVVGQASADDMKAADDETVFTGNRPDAVRYIAAAQLFVLPSLRDASPRVVREAQACGVPCVVTDIPGARNLIVADGPMRSGVLVRPGDADAIADAVSALLDNPAEMALMAKNAVANIDNNYRPQAYYDYFQNLFESLKN